MTTILILGGYGAVGREAAQALTSHPGTNVIVAGRNPDKVPPIPATTAMRVDAADPADLAKALDGVDTVLMCAEIDNARVARACVERGIHYVDVTASPAWSPASRPWTDRPGNTARRSRSASA
ncbi:saccharopine dehydrogenase NADP-binding domain-containing protein [Nonomuraea roseola]|uniref:Saccharopine dehydrogenase NADP-binding domain-containing protein n=1 Tax=Nonomuraea roseola TaxID=46179 RepID=A0ABV5Q460_9ACTN